MQIKLRPAPREPANPMTLPAKPIPAAAKPTGTSATRAGGNEGARAPVISIRDLKAHCSTCSMRELCLPVGLDRRRTAAGRRPCSATGSSCKQGRLAVSRRRGVLVAVRGAHRLAQDHGAGRGRARAGFRLPHARRHHRPRRHRHRPPRLPGGRARGHRGLRAAVRAARGTRAQHAGAAAQPLPVPVARDLARPQHHAAARQHARRGAARRVPAQPLRALPHAAATRRPSSCCG